MASHFDAGTRDAVPTPALILDLDVLERNIATMSAKALQWGVGLRPHVKTHKCVAIAQRQVASGALGVTCVTLDEAAAMVGAGIRGVLVSSPVVSPERIEILIQLLASAPDLMVVADNAENVQTLANAAARAGRQLAVAVDVDVGQQRTGCRSADSAVQLARRIAAAASLRFAGIQAYAGHIQHIAEREERRRAAAEVASLVRKVCAGVSEEGLKPAMVSGSGTGTVEFDGPGGVFTELQPGSYLFMDADYLAVQSGTAGWEFEPALFVDTTVVSVEYEQHVTTDAGTKAFALNGPMPAIVGGEPGWTYEYHGDEHGRVRVPPGSRKPRLGERLTYIVSHCDPTVSLYPQFVCVRGRQVQEFWSIEQRLAPVLSPKL